MGTQTAKYRPVGNQPASADAGDRAYQALLRKARESTPEPAPQQPQPKATQKMKADPKADKREQLGYTIFTAGGILGMLGGLFATYQMSDYLANASCLELALWTTGTTVGGCVLGMGAGMAANYVLDKFVRKRD